MLALDHGGTHLRTAVAESNGTLTGKLGSRSPMASGAETGPDVPRAIADRELSGPLETVHVDEAASAGDALALHIIARALRAFAAAIVSIVNVFDPDRNLVGGRIAMAWGDRSLGPARVVVEAHTFRVQASRVRIVPAALGDDVALVGALPLVAFAV